MDLLHTADSLALGDSATSMVGQDVMSSMILFFSLRFLRRQLLRSELQMKMLETLAPLRKADDDSNEGVKRVFKRMTEQNFTTTGTCI